MSWTAREICGSRAHLSFNTAGKGDETQELLKECRRAAEQDEKETHTYRTTRGTEAEDSADKFVVFEEYTLPNGLNDHS